MSKKFSPVDIPRQRLHNVTLQNKLAKVCVKHYVVWIKPMTCTWLLRFDLHEKIRNVCS